MNEKELLAQLAQPFEPKHITWKPGATSGEKCLALAYADLRAYQERLDSICGLDWSIEYLPWGDSRVIARLTIGGVTRSSTGEMSNQDVKNEMGGTVAEAQAMKRAAAQFGLGRYLYDLPSVWIAFDASKKRITEQGRKELDSRYAAWYKRTTAQDAPQPTQRAATPDATATQPDAAQQAATPATGDDKPTDEEHDIISQWSSPTEAQSWAIMLGACANEHEARNSFKHVVDSLGGKLTKENIGSVYLAWVRKVQGKLAQAQAA